jgi:hypothetical protein
MAKVGRAYQSRGERSNCDASKSLGTESALEWAHFLRPLRQKRRAYNFAEWSELYVLRMPPKTAHRLVLPFPAA